MPLSSYSDPRDEIRRLEMGGRGFVVQPSRNRTGDPRKGLLASDSQGVDDR
jgi:hypothetical protein